MTRLLCMRLYALHVSPASACRGVHQTRSASVWVWRHANFRTIISAPVHSCTFIYLFVITYPGNFLEFTIQFQINLAKLLYTTSRIAFSLPCCCIRSHEEEAVVCRSISSSIKCAVVQWRHAGGLLWAHRSHYCDESIAAASTPSSAMAHPSRSASIALFADHEPSM